MTTNKSVNTPNASSLVKYYDLIISCPACLCDGKTGGAQKQWYHANCGGKIQVGDNACYKCCTDNFVSHIKNWRYACEAHESDYRKTTPAHFASAISAAGQVTSLAGVKWLQKLLENLGEDW